MNAVMTGGYWLVGRYIVEFEQAGGERAKYRTTHIAVWSRFLSARHEMCSPRQLVRYGQFSVAFEMLFATIMTKRRIDPYRDVVDGVKCMGTRFESARVSAR